MRASKNPTIIPAGPPPAMQHVVSILCGITVALRVAEI
jgi:hypothetical protein